MDYTQIDLLQKETITYPLSYPVPCYLGVDDYYARYIKKKRRYEQQSKFEMSYIILLFATTKSNVPKLVEKREKLIGLLLVL